MLYFADRQMYEFAVTPATLKIRRRGAEIAEVVPGSLGAELELEAGDRIIRINGRKVRDYLDFNFYTAGETQLTLEVIKRNGEHWELIVERDEDEEWGLTFEQIVPRQCANECIFCFCKGNPPDARPALFIRDEDVRLSFLYGNYTTLTSITEEEMERVIEQHLSPQYVSIHATDLDVRAYLLGIDRRRADITAKLRRLMDAGIEIHAQVVLCPTINDGPVLIRTIEDLAAHYPRIRSVAIVPLGLTRYNRDPRLVPVTAEFCRRVIAEVTPIQRRLRKRLGTTFAFLGDEIYLRAGHPIPSRRHYGDYPQIEDGVGMVRTFYENFNSLWRRLQRRPPAHPEKLNGTLLTGKLFAPILRERIERLNQRFGTRLHVLGVENRYFGPEIVVTGLITGSDILAMRQQIAGDFVAIPRVVFRGDEDIMLDGMRLPELQAEFEIPLHPIEDLHALLLKARDSN
jgi:putative radical SAM enzyme (TIGR03279 family)